MGFFGSLLALECWATNQRRPPPGPAGLHIRMREQGQGGRADKIRPRNCRRAEAAATMTMPSSPSSAASPVPTTIRRPLPLTPMLSQHTSCTCTEAAQCSVPYRSRIERGSIRCLPAAPQLRPPTTQCPTTPTPCLPTRRTPSGATHGALVHSSSTMTLTTDEAAVWHFLAS